MSIGAIKGVEIGAGFNAAAMTGFENNDFYKDEDGHVNKATNHAGGMTGGISDGSEITIRAAVKPTPSIHLEQKLRIVVASLLTSSLAGVMTPLLSHVRSLLLKI